MENGNVNIQRVPNVHFAQTYANSLEVLDYRQSIRKFKELPDELFDENLCKIIEYIFLKIRSFIAFFKARLIVHHVLVECIDRERVLQIL